MALSTFPFVFIILKQILPSIGAFGFKIPPTIQGKQYFQLKCRVHERLIGFRNFAHECLENTTKCFLKTTMDFVIGIGSKEPKHRFSWGLILDKLQLRSILYPLSQQKVSWISHIRRLESSSTGSSFPAEMYAVLFQFSLYTLTLLNQCHSLTLRIMLLVNVNLAYSAIPFSLSGNKVESLYIHFYAKDHRKKIRQAKYADGKPWKYFFKPRKRLFC